MHIARAPKGKKRREKLGPQLAECHNSRKLTRYCTSSHCVVHTWSAKGIMLHILSCANVEHARLTLDEVLVLARPRVHPPVWHNVEHKTVAVAVESSVAQPQFMRDVGPKDLVRCESCHQKRQMSSASQKPILTLTSTRARLKNTHQMGVSRQHTYPLVSLTTIMMGPAALTCR